MQRATDGQFPKYFVWENVPGAFSSNRGNDFRAVLEEIGQSEIPIPANGKWANAGLVSLPRCQIAWRVLDAQYWGVPQRRKRIFLVADFTERRAGEILFISEGVSRDITQGEGERQRAAGDTQRSIGASSDCLTFDASQSYARVEQSEVGGTLKNSGGCLGGGSENYVIGVDTYNHKADNITPTIERNYGRSSGARVVVGCDVYNHTTTGDKACSLTAHSGSANTAGAKVITDDCSK